MKQKSILKRFVFSLLLFLLVPVICYGNAAEPPCFTVMVSNPPKDLSLSLQLSDGTQTVPILLKKETKAWESYYKFFYYLSPMTRGEFYDLPGAESVLLIQSNEKTFQCPLPNSTFSQYNNLLTLDMESETLTSGQPFFRTPLLVSLRVALTLVLEGGLFALFAYRQKRSWLAFLAINLVTQGGLNLSLTGVGINNYWMLSFIFCELVIIIVELIAFPFLIKEHTKKRAALYAVSANIASLLLGGLLLTFLPI